MKTKDLVAALLEADPESLTVIQVNHGEGYFSLHAFLLQLEDHPAHQGPILHIGQQTEDNFKEANFSKKE